MFLSSFYSLLYFIKVSCLRASYLPHLQEPIHDLQVLTAQTIQPSHNLIYLRLCSCSLIPLGSGCAPNLFCEALSLPDGQSCLLCKQLLTEYTTS